jgi:hypothetical protein
MELNLFTKHLQALRKDLQRLQEDFDLLRERVFYQDTTLLEMLERRGLKIFSKNPPDSLLFPTDFPTGHKLRFYHLLKRYSFRLFARDLIRTGDSFEPSVLTHYCSEAAVKRYLGILLKLGIIETEAENSYRLLAAPISSFGGTLEWFLAEIFKREFLSPALYGVRFKGSSFGGDYDVIALFERNLIYTEVKSSPPRGIELNEIQAFIGRINDLLPHMAIFFVDTELRMKDKVVPMFEEAIKDICGKKRGGGYSLVRLYQETFHLGNRLFIVNSKKDVATNLRRCLRHYLKFSQSAIKDLPWSCRSLEKRLR